MPYDVVRKFEKTIANFCGARYGISVSSCTNALFLCCKYLNVKTVTIPHKTYIGVPMSIIHAGGKVEFEDVGFWRGGYQLKPYPIYDHALQFGGYMFTPGSYTCLSFHYGKHIPIGRGGMILTNSKKATEWFKMARFDGREEKDLLKQKRFNVLGYNMYMTPEQASRGLTLFNTLWKGGWGGEDKSDYNTYPDLSKMEVFK